MSDLRYPIGLFEAPDPITPDHLGAWIDAIEALPDQMRAAVAGLSDADLDTPYRPGGWTLRQVVHHVPDSHLNSYVRFKWALTEAEPTIKAYDEVGWAELPDVAGTPVEVSLDLLGALHTRWVVLLRSLTEADWQRRFVHPASGPMPLAEAAGRYAWHGRHHLAHVTTTVGR
ncbi:MAG: YfiT family bacillithiol transferase [Bacteroidota bacterium]